jgi:hypothetical protein
VASGDAKLIDETNRTGTEGKQPSHPSMSIYYCFGLGSGSVALSKRRPPDVLLARSLPLLLGSCLRLLRRRLDCDSTISVFRFRRDNPAIFNDRLAPHVKRCDMLRGNLRDFGPVDSCSRFRSSDDSFHW